MGTLPAGFKIIPGFEAYAVSRDGVVIRAKGGMGARVGKPLAITVRNDGYLSVGLCVGNRVTRCYVHRLVALAHIGPPPSPDHEVAHANGVRSDCRVENLRWATRLENHGDRRAHGTILVGTDHRMAKLNDDAVRCIRRLYGTVPVIELSRRYGVDRALIRRVVRRENWKHVA